MYQYSEENRDEYDFIDKRDILKYVTEEEVFELVLGYKPIEFEYICSPLREDTNAGCWFEFDTVAERLKFRDFGYGSKSLDCFDMVQIYFGLPNFYKTLDFVKNKLILGREIDPKILHVKRKTLSKEKRVKKSLFQILPSTRDFSLIDKEFWSPFGISKENIISDKVFPAQKIKLKNTKKGDILMLCKTATYVYTEFKSGNRKIYQPYENKRFITNCVSNDIGGLHDLPAYGRKLVISKSYKDWRVLRNKGINSIWLQNEGMFPDKDTLLSILIRFKEVIIFFDNDTAGIEAAKRLKEYITKIYKPATYIIIPELYLYQYQISDISDLFKKRGEHEVISFLVHFNLLIA